MKRFFCALAIFSVFFSLGSAAPAQTTSRKSGRQTIQKKVSNPVPAKTIPCPAPGKEVIPVKTSEVDKPLKIISMPKASWTKEALSAANLQGIARLRVTFLDCGKIGKIQPVSRLPYGLTENAVEAAKKIRFEPAMKNGKPVTVAKVVEYPFTLY
jgi:hypothetical protein